MSLGMQDKYKEKNSRFQRGAADIGSPTLPSHEEPEIICLVKYGFILL